MFFVKMMEEIILNLQEAINAALHNWQLANGIIYQSLRIKIQLLVSKSIKMLS